MVASESPYCMGTGSRWYLAMERSAHGASLHRVIRKQWQPQVRLSIQTSAVTASGSTTAAHGASLHRVIRKQWQPQVHSSIQTSEVTVSGSTTAAHGASLHRVIPEAMAAAGSLFYTDFGSNGIWMYNGSAWSQLTPGNPEAMAAAGSLSIQTSEVTASGCTMAAHGARLTPANPQFMGASGNVLYADFAGNGIWKLEAGSWTSLTSTDPTLMVAGF